MSTSLPTSSRRAALPPAVGERTVVVALALLAATSESLSTWKSGDSEWGLAGEVLVQIVAVWCALRWVERRFGRQSHAPIVAPVIAALALGACLAEPLWRSCGCGRSGEVVLLDSLKLATLGLACFSRWSPLDRVTVGMALFLQLFAASLSTSTAIHLLTACFASLAIAWASSSYWRQLQPRLLTQPRSASSRGRWLLGGVCLLAIGMLLVQLDHTPLVRSLRGMAPTSGAVGGQQYDPFARDGVGEGDAAVAGKDHIRSFAPIDDAPFISIDQPSLYDVFDEQYGEAISNKKVERAISLTQDRVVQQRCNNLTQVSEVGREFKIQRRGPSAATSTARPAPPALLHVVGRTPLHLRMEVFDVFDGLRWYADETQPKRPQPLKFEQVDGRPWLRPPQRAESINIFRGRDTHALKIINLDSNRIPAPNHLSGVHIAKVDDLSMFRWAQPSVLCMDRQRIPPLSILHVASEPVDWSFVAHSYLRAAWVHEAYAQFPEVLDRARIEQLGRAWTGGTARGWPQIMAVVNRIRTDYQLDPQAVDTPDDTTPVEHFLFATKRGPDYQFATATALVLRSLGYSTRLVRGFYASPNNYDARLGHTPVTRSDAHCWLEVYMSAEMWLSLEPTPGYELLAPPRTLFEQVQAALGSLGRWARAQWLVLAVIGACGAIVYCARHRLRDQLRTLLWHGYYARHERRSVSHAARLLDDRCRWSGVPRPPGVTLGRWLRTLTISQPATQSVSAAELEAFLRLLDWVTCAPLDCRPPRDDARRVSRQLLATCSLRRLAQSRRSVSSCGANAALVSTTNPSPRFRHCEA